MSLLGGDTSLMMEHAFARVPYEDFRRGFRTGQKHVEREFLEMKKILASSSLSDPQLIDALIAKARGLEEKMTALPTTSTLTALRARLEHIHCGKHTDSQLQRWLVDWSLRSGKGKTAEQLAASIPELVDVPLFSTISTICSSLHSHDCAPALAWAKRNRMPDLEFELRLQQFVELCRIADRDGAIEYSRKWFSSFYDKHDAEIRQAMGLLIYPPTLPITLPVPYKRLYNPNRWVRLQELFRHAAYDMYSLPHEPILWMAMYGGLVALKHPADVERNPDCPVCAVPGNPLTTLVDLVPSAHHPNSVIVCRLTGKITNEPMAFPNSGCVYGREGLEAMAFGTQRLLCGVNVPEGYVRCPRTGEICAFDDLKKVFIS